MEGCCLNYGQGVENGERCIHDQGGVKEQEAEPEFEITVVANENEETETTVPISRFLKKLKRHLEGTAWDRLFEEATAYNWYSQREGADGRRMLKQVVGLEALARMYRETEDNVHLHRFFALHVCAVVAGMQTMFAKKLLHDLEARLNTRELKTKSIRRQRTPEPEPEAEAEPAAKRQPIDLVLEAGVHG